ncbi:MAG: hypothetical protein P1P85_00690 [Patescibacteria group bacterium]|nr:hypothetical protein [Patescibacteria group bacterium]
MREFKTPETQSDNYFENLRSKFTAKNRNEQESINGINGLLKQIYQKFNNEFGTDIINEDGSIKGFSQEMGGKEKQEEYYQKLDLWKKEYESYNEFIKRKETNKGIIWEKISLVILNKILGKDFIVIHSSQNDDIHHSIDTIIIDKKSGEVVCTIDDVETDTEESRYLEKLKKLTTINQKFGGAFIEDGLELIDGKLINKHIRNIPIYLLQISEKNFEKVLSGMDINSIDAISDIELNIFDILIESLENQNEKLKNTEKIPINLKKKTSVFSESLEKMKIIRNKIDINSEI